MNGNRLPVTSTGGLKPFGTKPEKEDSYGTY